MNIINVQMDGKLMEVLVSIRIEGIRRLWKWNWGEGLKNFGAWRDIFNVRSISMGVKKELYESLVVLTVAYGALMWGVGLSEISAECYRNYLFPEYFRSS